jgi:hypothetical protein
MVSSIKQMFVALSFHAAFLELLAAILPDWVRRQEDPVALGGMIQVTAVN